jgi:sulfatase maturation enzyme AslB (radical SAM superfamily)
VFFYTNKKIATEFTGAYNETETRGIITKISGRTLLEIDSVPALKKYGEWRNIHPDNLKGLNLFYNIENKELSLGCQACKSGSWFNVHLGYECNLNCKYCAQGSFADKKEKKDEEVEKSMKVLLDSIQALTKEVAELKKSQSQPKEEETLAKSFNNKIDELVCNLVAE